MTEFLADLDSLEGMMQLIRSEAQKAGIEDLAIHKMELACEEVIVNIISYAYPSQKGKLVIDCSQRGHRFEITFRDHGVPFNPIDVEVDPQLDLPIEERNIGGLGIFLLRKAIDEASYHREEDENVLQLAYIIP